MGLCVGSLKIPVNTDFSQTRCHKQEKKVNNQLRHRHNQSCAFHQSKKKKKGTKYMYTGIIISATPCVPLARS